MTGKQHERTFWGAGDVQFSNVGADDDREDLVCEKVLNRVLRICVFPL